jgi:predicted RNA-binding protein Jag
MSDVERAGAAGEVPQASGRDKRAWAEEVIGDLLRLTGLRARLEVKEIASSVGGMGLSVALFPEEENAGLQTGKRSPVVESLQFLANKIVNRGPEKKWIAIGVGSHPEPRVPGGKPPRAEPTPKAAGNASGTPPAPRATPTSSPSRAQAPERGAEMDESSLEVTPDPLLEAAGRSLAEKAAATGRFYAVAPMKAEDRARLARGGKGIAGVSVKVEGEGRHRRVVFAPANPKPMPRKSAMPDYDDEDDSEE